MQRLSNNNCPKFSDRELITVYLWGLKQQLPTRKAIYNYTKTHLANRFRNLPSYQAFCRRLNRLAGAFRALAEIWTEKAAAQSERSHHFVLDSCPILLAKDSRFGLCLLDFGFQLLIRVHRESQVSARG